MKKEDSKVLLTVFSEVIEQSAFMFTESLEKDEIEIEGSTFTQASITFSGPVNGMISMAFPSDLSCEMAANFLGLDEEDPIVLESEADAVGELLNMVVGKFLTDIEGTEPVFDLSVPLIEELSAEKTENLLKDEFCATISTEDEPVIFNLHI